MGHRGTISRPVKYGLYLMGLWPRLPYAVVNWSLYMLSLLVAQYSMYSYVALHFDLNDIYNLFDCLSLGFGYTLLTIKLGNLWFNRRAFCKMVDAIDDDWKEGSAVASNLTVMVQKAELSRTCSNVLMSFNAVGALLYVMGGYVIQALQSENGTREFPVRMEIPYDIRSPPIFVMTLLVQCVHQLSVATLTAVLNGLVVTLLLHVSGQIDIVCESVREITPKSFESLGTMKKLISQHQKIIDFANNINDVFSLIALLEFLWNSILICCIGFVIVASIGTEDAPTLLTKSVTFYIAITVEAFVFCYGGEYLTAKSKSIGDAVYDSLWYNLKPRDCQVLLFILVRSQKHLTISAGSLMDLSLEGFTSIMKASASYISVLHALY